MELLAAPALNIVFGQLFGAILGAFAPKPPPGRSISLMEIIDAIRKELIPAIQDEVRSAFSDHVFQLLQADSLSTLRYLEDYGVISRGTDPHREEFLIQEAYRTVVRATSLLETEYKRQRGTLSIEPISWEEEKPESIVVRREKIADAAKTKMKIESFLRAIKTIGSLDLCITSIIAERTPDLRGRVIERMQLFRGMIDELTSQARRLRGASVDVIQLTYPSNKLLEIKEFMTSEISIKTNEFGMIKGSYQYPRIEVIGRQFKIHDPGTAELLFPGGVRESKPIAFIKEINRGKPFILMNYFGPFQWRLDRFVGKWITETSQRLFDEQPPTYIAEAIATRQLFERIAELNGYSPPLIPSSSSSLSSSSSSSSSSSAPSSSHSRGSVCRLPVAP